MSKPFFIVGPTAVGKTRLALEVAARTGAEIVNADAFQVYAGLDLLTAKPTPEERRRITHHLVGSVPLAESYNVARYLAAAETCLQDIAARGRRALVVGGTGLYVKALTHGLAPLPSARPELRAELEQATCAELLARLRELDPPAAFAVDGRNQRRLVRAVEVCLVTGRRFSDLRTGWRAEPASGAAAGVFLTCERAALYARIEQRTRGLFEQGGVEEVRATPPAVLSSTAAQVIGYSEIRAHLAGFTSLSDCQSRIAAATRHYAKRQMTWFRAGGGFEALEIPRDDGAALVERVLNRMDPATNKA